ncbi:hypothetical protein ES703_54136 [subsurface metagenome]|jgi:hypothetical protein
MTGDRNVGIVETKYLIKCWPNLLALNTIFIIKKAG